MLSSHPLNRRQFLKGTGAAICLPYLPSLFPRGTAVEAQPPPVRLMFMCVPLGFVPSPSIISHSDPGQTVAFSKEGWFPDEIGSNYKLPGVHAALAPFRNDISFLKGLGNHKYRGESHYGDDVFLTCADTMLDPSKLISNTISCDQVAAATPLFAKDVRYPSLSLGINPVLGTHTGGLSWADGGLPISPMRSPMEVFDHLFGKDDMPIQDRVQRLKEQRSILDMMRDQVSDLDRTLNATDSHKLDEVLTAVRGVEAEIQREEAWANIPKAKVGFPRPEVDGSNTQTVKHAKAMFDLVHAAFLTDTTRVVTYEMPDVYKEYAKTDKHGLNHGGTAESQAAALRFDLETSNQLARFIGLMGGSADTDGKSLLHHTAAVLGAGLWGQTHYRRSLPAMLIGHCGGKLKQGFTRSYDESTPMANLWLTMLNASGIPMDSFADSTGILADLL